MLSTLIFIFVFWTIATTVTSNHCDFPEGDTFMPKHPKKVRLANYGDNMWVFNIWWLLLGLLTGYWIYD